MRLKKENQLNTFARNSACENKAMRARKEKKGIQTQKRCAFSHNKEEQNVNDT